MQLRILMQNDPAQFRVAENMFMYGKNYTSEMIFKKIKDKKPCSQN